MNTDELQQLRDQVMNDVVPLVIETGSGQDRFDVLLRIIQSGNTSLDVYTRAYESAQKIESADDRLAAMLALVDEIDLQLRSTPGPNQSGEHTDS
jgi:hypothetical protein